MRVGGTGGRTFSGLDTWPRLVMLARCFSERRRIFAGAAMVITCRCLGECARCKCTTTEPATWPDLSVDLYFGCKTKPNVNHTISNFPVFDVRR
jgi:hypothetical protein